MKIVQRIQENDCEIAILNIHNSLNYFTKSSNKSNNLEFKNEKRQKEFFSIRLLLKELLPNANISYNKYGAPEIEGDIFISISHSKNITGIIISKKKVGLDIEKISDKALRLSSKFILNNRHHPLTKEKATLIWCCKEAIYKWHQKGNVNFIEDIKIYPFDIKSGNEIIAEFQDQKLFIQFKKIQDYFLVYVCK